MAFDELRNGDMPEQQAGKVYLDPLWADALQTQAAAALQTQWVNVPIVGALPGTKHPSYVTWSTSMGPGGLLVKGWTLTPHTSDDVTLYAAIPGSQIMRHRSEIIAARVFVGGAFTHTGTAGTVKILRDLDYGDPATGPAPVSIGSIWSGTGPGVGSYAVHSVDWTSSPKVIDEDLDYYLLVSRLPVGTGTFEFFGAQIKVQFPLTANP
jgi:hypothetical protein